MILLVGSICLFFSVFGQSLEGELSAAEFFLYDQKRIKEARPRAQLSVGSRLGNSSTRSEIFLSASPSTNFVSHHLGLSQGVMKAIGFRSFFYETRWPRNGLSLIQIHFRGSYLFQPAGTFEFWYGASMNAIEITSKLHFSIQADKREEQFMLGGLLIWSL